MSVYRGAKNAGWFGSNLSEPIAICLNFTVDPTNGNGLGIRSLKSNGWVRNVFMNTSASFTGTVATTAAQITGIASGTATLLKGMPVQGTGIPTGTIITGILSSSSVSISATPTGNHTSETITYQGYNGGIANPNPAAGYALIQMKQNFNIYLGGFTGFVSPTTGSTLTSITLGTPYIITSLGTTTLAQWNLAGLPLGLTPTVGQSFIAGETGAIGGTGTVKVQGVSGIVTVEVVGDPNQSISNSSIAANGGAWLLVQFLAATSTTVTTLIPTAPAANSTGGLFIFMDQSTADPIMVNGDPVTA